VIVSNRISLPREQNRAGGLAVAVRDVLRRHGGIWFGWSGDVVAETSAAPSIKMQGRVAYATFDLGTVDHAEYYNGFANSTLWPLFHYRLGLVEFRRRDFDGYLRVNTRISQYLAPLIKPEDLIWIHDYHLIPLGAELRKLGINNRIGFFLHTPFPGIGVFEALPRYEMLLQALCAYDVIGFQTDTDLRSFRHCITTFADGALLEGDLLSAFGRIARASAFPIGIDTDAFVAMAAAAAGAEDTVRLKDSLAGRHLIIGVDRLDYSKGIPQRFAAFAQLLSDRPEHRSHATLMQIAPTSRGEVAQYRALRHELEGAAGRINSKFAEFDWTPIRYLTKGFRRHTLAGFYRLARIGLVTPMRDGMNLVAKEYVAAQDPADPGVLVLSKFAGAARELTSALVVNPLDVDEISAALHAALAMPHDERSARWNEMMSIVRKNTVQAWHEAFLAALAGASVADANHSPNRMIRALP
jgi:trehalose 6-phosphate synthase